jgi:hypothetical protein
MITAEMLLSSGKEALGGMSGDLDRDDIKQLVLWLAEKDDTLRYNSYLLLKYHSEISDEVYQYMDVFRRKLKSENSYQRSLGVMLIAANARWDSAGKVDSIIGDYLSILQDEKPITVRQCIQSLNEIIPYKKQLLGRIASGLMSIRLETVKETMRKLILVDILNALVSIRKQEYIEDLESYIINALSGGILDRKSVKQFESMLKQ